MIRAAGIVFLGSDRVLLLQRSGEGDAAGQWAFPGGKIEDGESPENAAVRECTEELGHCPAGRREILARRIKDDVDYTTFLQKVEMPFSVTLNDEHTEYRWAPAKGPYPEPLHPGALVALDRLFMNELDIARAMAADDLTSPQSYMNLTLFKVRITGTGISYRGKHKEYVYRTQEYFLSQEFIDRCNAGLPIIFEHPDDDALNSQEFSERVVGTIMFSYIVENEVWGIARIYDDAAAKLMEFEQWSTSPSVIFRGGTIKKTLDDGTKVLIEGSPALLDHLAICPRGVWDKAGEPSGVISTTVEDENQMAESMEKPAPVAADAKKDTDDMPAPEMQMDKARKDAEERARKDAENGAKLDKMLSCMDAMMSAHDSMAKRMDSFEQRFGKKDPDTSPIAKEGEKPSERGPALETKPADLEAEADRARVADEELSRRIADAVEKQTKPMPETEEAKYTDAQARADAAYATLGKGGAPKAMRGETLIGYRKRLAKGLQSHSKRWKTVELALIPGAALEPIEADIYADAMEAGMRPTDVPRGKFREIVRVDPITGQRRIDFVGSTTIFGLLKAPARYVTRIGQPSNGNA
jgi:8-oxo-dGTP pyrophosphatase MutT (NUDIX family)